MKEVNLVIDAKATLGEGAIWDYKNNRILWIDIEECSLNIFYPNEKENRKIKLNQKIGTVVPVEIFENVVLIALEDGIYYLVLASEHVYKMIDLESKIKNNRFNDGKCDPAGRFWVGSMDMNLSEGKGSLYCIDTNLSVKKNISGVTISNGIAWSVDSTMMYYIDTPTRAVAEYRYNIETASIKYSRIAIEIEKELGYPDGMTIDSEGKLWIAMWGGGYVTRWDPETGKLLEKIELPALNVTSCAFGGKNLDTLYITSAIEGVSEENRNKYPFNGGLFSVKPGITGIKANYFDVDVNLIKGDKSGNN